MRTASRSGTARNGTSANFSSTWSRSSGTLMTACTIDRSRRAALPNSTARRDGARSPARLGRAFAKRSWKRTAWPIAPACGSAGRRSDLQRSLAGLLIAARANSSWYASRTARSSIAWTKRFSRFLKMDLAFRGIEPFPGVFGFPGQVDQGPRIRGRPPGNASAPRLRTSESGSSPEGRNAKRRERPAASDGRTVSMARTAAAPAGGVAIHAEHGLIVQLPRDAESGHTREGGPQRGDPRPRIRASRGRSHPCSPPPRRVLPPPARPVGPDACCTTCRPFSKTMVSLEFRYLAGFLESSARPPERHDLAKTVGNREHHAIAKKGIGPSAIVATEEACIKLRFMRDSRRPHVLRKFAAVPRRVAKPEYSRFRPLNSPGLEILPSRASTGRPEFGLEVCLGRVKCLARSSPPAPTLRIDPGRRCAVPPCLRVPPPSALRP